jgi:hypothetical protein
MSEKAKTVITSVRKWSMVDEQTGKPVSGTSLDMLLYVKGNSFPIAHSMLENDQLSGARVGDQYSFDLSIASMKGKAVLRLDNFQIDKAS